MFAARLPEATFFSHSTAARLLGAPLPLRFERMTSLHATVEAPARAPHSKGVIGHSRQVSPGDVLVDDDGIRLSSAPRMLCEMASVLTISDLVAIADHIIRRGSPLASLKELSARIEVGDRITRSPRLRYALELCDERAESRPESILRVLLDKAGLPPARINHELVDTSSGREMRTDFAFLELMFAIEYQGDYHRSREQWRRDMTRRSRLEALGWYVMELNGDDLRDPVELVARVRTVLERQSRLFARLEVHDGR